MPDNIPQGIVTSKKIYSTNTLGAFTLGYWLKKISLMDQFTNEQLLLLKVRNEFCGGNAALLAREIGKDGTYVNRLFYPLGKKGRKGIGLEIMQACTKRFTLPAGFWEQMADASVKLLDGTHSATTHQQPAQAHEPSPQYGARWPFDQITPIQYELLDQHQRAEVEKYVLLQLRSREPPEKQNTPDQETATLHVHAA